MQQDGMNLPIVSLTSKIIGRGGDILRSGSIQCWIIEWKWEFKIVEAKKLGWNYRVLEMVRKPQGIPTRTWAKVASNVPGFSLTRWCHPHKCEDQALTWVGPFMGMEKCFVSCFLCSDIDDPIPSSKNQGKVEALIHTMSRDWWGKMSLDSWY
jgi:hypothetical protein